MLTFTLAISCFTTSNLLWFKDLLFHVPVRYCSYSIGLPSPVTSTTGCCFCFGSISSFFLELVLHWSPGAYWAPTDLGSSSFSVLSVAYPCHFIIWVFSFLTNKKEGLDKMVSKTPIAIKSSCVVALYLVHLSRVLQFSSVAQSCPTFCDPMNCSTLGLPVHYQLPEFTQTHVHWVGDAIQPSHPLSSSSPSAPNPSQHQSLFQWVNSSHEMAKVLEFQL